MVKFLTENNFFKENLIADFQKNFLFKTCHQNLKRTRDKIFVMYPPKFFVIDILKAEFKLNYRGDSNRQI